jgi:hypothetical protein
MGTNAAIVSVEPSTPSEWKSVAEGCDYATYFHSPEWFDLWHRYKGKQVSAAPQTVVFSDQKRAIVPMARNLRGRGLLTTLTTSMEGTFGGYISTDALEEEHCIALADHLLLGSHGNLSWRVNPYAPFATQVLSHLRSRSGSIDMTAPKNEKVRGCLVNWRRPLLIPDETHSIELSPGFASLYGNQSATVRKAKKARKAGVQIRSAESEADWKEYYQVYQSSVERWGNDPASSYEWELFREMFALGSANVKLWLATLDSRIVSGALCFYAKKHVVYWHGSSLKEFFELRPVNLLMLEIVKHCCEQGYAWYDFNPSGQMKGVISFKESFGAKPLACPLIYVDTNLKRAARTALLGAKGYL